MVFRHVHGHIISYIHLHNTPHKTEAPFFCIGQHACIPMSIHAAFTKHKIIWPVYPWSVAPQLTYTADDVAILFVYLFLDDEFKRFPLMPWLYVKQNYFKIILKLFQCFI